jgi:cation transporter-like permease
MDRTLLKALYVILISLSLALIFNFLFFGKLIGISVFIFAAILLAALVLLGSRNQPHFQKSWWMLLLISFFALMPSIRANEFLNFLNICAILGLLMLLAHELAGTPAFLMRLRDYLALAVLVPLRMLGRALSTVSLIGHIHSDIKKRDMWLRVIKGTIMAVPVLIIFGVLFSQADLAFSQFLKGFVSINISERTVQYFVLLLFAFVAALSFLSYIFFPRDTKPEVSPEKPVSVVQSGRGVEVLVFLGLISVLFLVFIGFQVTYLFGGEMNIINAGFTYAEYARRGFFELLAVAMLSLLVLLASEKYSGSEFKKDKRFEIPALLLIAEVVIVIVSAFKRLSLYIDAYGLTLLRFYVAGFIMLLLALFILLAVKFAKSKREQFFTFGTLLSVAAILVAVNIINPDAFIARSNIEQYNRTGKIDVSYIRELSADAEPGKIELYEKLEGEDKQTLRGLLQKEKENLQKYNDWQSANLSRTRALKLLQEF